MSATPTGAATTPAGIVTRGLAVAVDLVVTIAGVALVYLGASTVRFAISPRSFHAVRPPAGVGVAVWLAFAAVYLAVAWVSTGRTVGQQLLGLRVVSRSGSPLRPAVALVRAILCLAFPIGLLWSAASRRSASVQDLLLGTRVVYDWEVHAPSPTVASASSGAGVGMAPHAPGG
jgi:uncharacterized RDD family membrane protein YckC